MQGYIYLGTDFAGGLVKIGRTNNPLRRVQEIRNMNPTFHMPLILKSDNMEVEERYLHIAFKDKRIEGEWFELSADDVARILIATGHTETARDLGSIRTVFGIE
jgi:hypothetical protein